MYILAAVATLTLGLGSAFAQSLTPSNYPQVQHSGPAYSSDVSGN